MTVIDSPEKRLPIDEINLKRKSISPKAAQTENMKLSPRFDSAKRTADSHNRKQSREEIEAIIGKYASTTPKNKEEAKPEVTIPKAPETDNKSPKKASSKSPKKDSSKSPKNKTSKSPKNTSKSPTNAKKSPLSSSKSPKNSAKSPTNDIKSPTNADGRPGKRKTSKYLEGLMKSIE